MKRWQDFLDSLSTSGGAVLVLFLICLSLLPVLIYFLHREPNSPATTRLTDAFVGFSGALLLALRGNASRQQMMDRASGVAPSPKAIAAEAAAEAPKSPEANS
jgi:drug/metabolite transporter (DMT)-like permease